MPDAEDFIDCDIFPRVERTDDEERTQIDTDSGKQAQRNDGTAFHFADASQEDVQDSPEEIECEIDQREPIPSFGRVRDYTG